MPRRPLAIAVAALALVLAACGDSDDDGGTDAVDLDAPATTTTPPPTVPPEVADDAVVLSVEGTDVTEADLRAELAEAAAFAELNPGRADGFLPDVDGNSTLEAAQQQLEQLIEGELAAAELAARGGEVTDEDREVFDEIVGQVQVTPWFEAFVERSVVSVALQRVILEEAGVPATAEEWYAENGLSCSRHILFDTADEEGAIAARERLVDGGEDFAELAIELSTGPSGPNGGDLGCGDPSQFVPEFAEALVALEPGEISEPVMTDFGWHVILADGDRDFADVEVEATQAWQTESQEALVEPLTALTTEADVTLAPEYGTWDGTGIRP
ncbi:MAG: peptidylprolyl isomerase [Actinomycetota bacterium]